MPTGGRFPAGKLVLGIFLLVHRHFLSVVGRFNAQYHFCDAMSDKGNDFSQYAVCGYRVYVTVFLYAHDGTRSKHNLQRCFLRKSTQFEICRASQGQHSTCKVVWSGWDATCSATIGLGTSTGGMHLINLKGNRYSEKK